MQRTNCLKQTNNNNNEQKQFFQLMLLRKKISPQKWVLLGLEHRPFALPVQGSNHWASKPTASWSFLILFLFLFLEAFFLLLLSCVFNCDHFLCIYFWFKYMKFINSSLQISSGKLFVAFTIYNKAMFVKLSTSFSIPFYANLLRFPSCLEHPVSSRE